MKFKKILIWVIIIGLLGWWGYIAYQDYLVEQEAKAREDSFVARQVSPFQENNEGIYYYYKSIGGEQYFADECYIVYARNERSPSHVTMNDTDITEQVCYDFTMKTLIFPADLMEQIPVGEYWIRLFDDSGEEYCGYSLHVLEECTFNVPAQHATLQTYDRQIVYSKQDNNEISYYFNNIGDNPIVNVVRFRTDEWGSDFYPAEYLAPEDYTISGSGNKVTISCGYLSNQSVHDRVTLGFRLADGSFLEPDNRHIWIMTQDWDGFVLTDLADYSLSSGKDFVLHYEMQKSTVFFGFNLINITNGEYTECISHGFDAYYAKIEGREQEYIDFENKSITIPADFMATLPVGQYILESYHWYGRSSGGTYQDEEMIYATEIHFFEIDP